MIFILFFYKIKKKNNLIFIRLISNYRALLKRMFKSILFFTFRAINKKVKLSKNLIFFHAKNLIIPIM